MYFSISKLDNGSITSPKGFLAGGVHAGLRYAKKDLGMIYSQVPATAVAVHTLNQFIAAPNQVTKQSIAVEQKIQAVVTNSACANACTGSRGMEDALTMRRLAAEKFGIPEHYVAVASTGVIGEFLDMEKIRQGIAAVVVEATQEGAKGYEKAIMTTDLIEKYTGYEAEIDGVKVTMGGCCKGSGMIHPNMATMLGYITTDALVDSDALKKVFSLITDLSFNQITVDGETSTNDMVLLLANGMAGNEILSEDHPQWPVFASMLTQTAQDLAKAIARDGEGATKLIEVHVKGAATDQAARILSKQIVGSSLVKTAVYGNDANWGRIVSAAGHANVPLDTTKVDVMIGDTVMLKNSEVVPFDEEIAKAYLQGEVVRIEVDFHMGDGSATAWGCDLTYKYVEINASYRS
ncbi:bifunctional ornithine acetyltransferase/N-acetylglutamate synthase [Proteiniclasticum sp. QWL-01]|uniref:bifunctional ornithine acetyltransferase/N-acetylglutamate synthase n=1 Tax=Proteiniclasticum sp. QWL-01 TaxID=3036945 RepID=UPI00220D5AA5|nr:bifunctional ornithine acetyltransferase/N-acetylglutamate synthase [Proteiniclasticum sp. QWL-01]UUM11531.1 bifunctional ornithine acetyltransferase/N-acetylglutamate synthase [Clostridiaceae bacterium HFYG-1003]WFF72989.1 bifunctional ornithine acetyltransferase/N-acetylglutamate synthase [Proteiniclasticum sp. QWL-01]